MPLILGVTGAIATGKSLVCRILEELGAVHCNADTLVHQLYAPGTPGFAGVVAAFGPEVIAVDGTIDRRVLGSKVFGRPEEMRRLTAAMGDIRGTIKGVVDRWRESLPPDAAAVLEAVNIIEPGYAAWLDQTWLVTASAETMLSRLIARNNLSRAEADQRLTSQRPWAERAPAADFVISNEGNREQLERVVKGEFERVCALHRRGELPPSRYHAWRQAQA